MTELDHIKLCDQFEEAHEQTQQERELAERDRDYYDGKQLTDEEIATLTKRGQPPVIFNRIAPKIDALLGHEKRMRADPRAYPRTPQHEEDAQSATDAIRFVCDENRFSSIRSAGAEDLLIEGIAAATVTIRMRGDTPDIKITHVPWDRFYRDPHSRKRDFSDAKYMGVVVWMDEEEALALGKEKEGVVSACYTESESDTYDDRPKLTWSDRKRKRIRVLQHRYLHDGKWHMAILCKGGFLRDPQVSPYVDEHGVPQCDLVATSAFITRENERYGVVRRHIHPQDEINKRRSKALWRLTANQIEAEEGAFHDVEQARREAARPDGVIIRNRGFEAAIREGSTLANGELALLQEAKAEIDASGVNPALSGDQKAPSGRAQEMAMTAGLAEMSTVFEALKMWSWEIYRQVWLRIRQYWTEERWIRVTDDERNMRWVAINKPVTRGEQIIQQAEQSGQPLAPEQLAQIQSDPVMQSVVGTQNAMSELDVDLILEDGPDSVTMQSEQYAELVELKKADPASIPTRAIIEASSLRNKDRIIEHLESGGIPPQVQQQMQEMQQALHEAQKKLADAEQKAAAAQGDAQLKQAEMAIKEQELQLEAMKLDLERYRAETERIQAMRPPEPKETEPADQRAF